MGSQAELLRRSSKPFEKLSRKRSCPLFSLRLSQLRPIRRKFGLEFCRFVFSLVFALLTHLDLLAPS